VEKAKAPVYSLEHADCTVRVFVMVLVVKSANTDLPPSIVSALNFY
jgi:hypothetical protein